MSSTKQDKREGVQPLDADDGVLADSTSDGELSGVSEGDGPLRQADEAESITTFSGDVPENLRGYAEPSTLPTGALQAQNPPPGRLRDGSESPDPAARIVPDPSRHAVPDERAIPDLQAGQVRRNGSPAVVPGAAFNHLTLTMLFSRTRRPTENYLA